jgi:hypothetical protein
MIAVAACLMMAGCERHPPATASAKEPDPAQITAFYASPAMPFQGEKALLCYGVANAEQVTIDPPVDRVWPAVSRCIEVAPIRATTYTLTAKRGSSAVSQAVTVTPGPPRMKQIEVSINKLEVAPGELVTVCYKARNASEVAIRPGSWVAHGPDFGCVQDHPQKDTTYIVTANGPGDQKDSERVTAKVK